MIERRIDIFPFKERKVEIIPTGKVLQLNMELESFVKEQWAPKKEAGWKSSWIPLYSKIDFKDDEIKFEAGVMTFAQCFGIIKAIEQGKSFTPKAMNNLSVGAIPVTSDGYVMVSRRNVNLPNAGGVWNFNGGYVTSLLIDKANCDDPKFITDPRVFDLEDQIRRRVFQYEFEYLQEEDVEISGRPDSLANDFYQSFMPQIGYVARINKSKKELIEITNAHESNEDAKEHTHRDFIHLEDLGSLLLNQGGLLNEDPTKYKTDDPRKIILLDENIGQLIGGSYKKITGQQLDPEFIERLRRDGLDIREFDTSPGTHYEFPTSY